jgi:hypothetical protein
MVATSRMSRSACHFVHVDQPATTPFSICLGARNSQLTPVWHAELSVLKENGPFRATLNGVC